MLFILYRCDSIFIGKLQKSRTIFGILLLLSFGNQHCQSYHIRTVVEQGVGQNLTIHLTYQLVKIHENVSSRIFKKVIA